MSFPQMQWRKRCSCVSYMKLFEKFIEGTLLLYTRVLKGTSGLEPEKFQKVPWDLICCVYTYSLLYV